VYFKDEAALRALNNPPDRPLRGIRIALDPGHIGGRWARIEEQFDHLSGEIAIPDRRAALFEKILGGASAIERAVAVDIAAALGNSTGLPAGGGGPGPRVGTNEYVVARNLAANRLFRCPVVFLEAYYMNNPVVFARLQAGDYDGEREVEGRRYRSVYREYADGAAGGVIAFYRRRTVRK
jgi:hypothetical protein